MHGSIIKCTEIGMVVKMRGYPRADVKLHLPQKKPNNLLETSKDVKFSKQKERQTLGFSQISGQYIT